jgi:hypothetical protein
VEAVAVTGDDEQGIVDADAEPDKRGELRAERRHRQHMTEEVKCAEHGGDGHDRGRDRQRHSDNRTEGKKQDDDRREEAEPLADPEGGTFDLLDRRPGQLRLEAGAVSGLRAMDDRTDRAVGDGVQGAVELDDPVGDVPVGADLMGTAWPEGAAHRRHVRHRAESAKRLGDERTVRWRRDRVLGAEYDLGAGPRLGREMLFQEGRRLLGLGISAVDVVCELCPGGPAEQREHDEYANPGEDNWLTVAIAP